MKDMSVAFATRTRRKLLGLPLTRRNVLAVAGAVALIMLLALIASGGHPIILLAVPLALFIIPFTVAYPFEAFVGTLCALSLIPTESRLLGIFIPNWMQLMFPALLVGALVQGLGRKGGRTFAVNWADVFVAGFIIFGYAAILGQPGPSSIKFYTNQQVVPMLMYFIAKWLPIDREKFHLQLRWQLLSVVTVSAIMLNTTVTRYDPFYWGFAIMPHGEMARGPMWSASDTVAYCAIWPVFFVYAIAIGLPALPRSWRRLWPVGMAMIILATMATGERTGPVAIAAGMAIIACQQRLRRYVLLCLVAIPLLLPPFLFTPTGRHFLERIDTVKEEGAGFERTIYRAKTLRYVRSPYWNPIMGTGFGRINEMSWRTMPEDEWVYDYNWQAFRPVELYGSRPTHCAPLTLFAEYGYGGVSLLLMAMICVAGALARLPAMARQRGMAVDSALIVTAVAAFAGVLANGLLHNTEAVVEVLISIWVFSGLVVGHPDIFLMPRVEKPAGP